ncbi:MAG: ABC transporter substrate-binding protein [Clostridia bacterium]|nr:ABC transporter substrate-binding protein [Lachnospiraceae bacterium]NCB99162.1 ABC transporter substrate-binding protein [Clostridia bacterium]NCD02229.1 ABC transporter substrate-binding protein [Clostridia bacterium]
MKKRIALLLSAVMVVSALTACGGGKTSGGSTSTTAAAGETSAETTASDGTVGAHKDSLIIGTDADINSLDLQQQQDQINNIVLKNTHQTLVFFNNDPEAAERFEPCLATSWEFTDDTHIKMTLRDDVYFNDGAKTPMTAEDVKFTLDMAMTTMAAPNLTGFVACNVVDDHTVEIEIESYNNEFVQSLASVNLSIQSKKAYDDGVEDPYYIGTGPYKFDEWVEGEYCRLVKVDDYWGNSLPAEDNLSAGVVETLEFRPYIEASSRVIALQAGEIDVCVNPPINELEYLEEDSNITVYEQAGTRLFYFAFNVEKAPWDNQKLRQAVACAIDRNAVLEAAVYGKGTPQTTILNRGLWGFYDDMEGFDYDVERAKELMAEAGYPDGGITTTLTYASGAPYDQIATVIQANLAEIGVTVTLNQMETATLKSTCVEGGQELFLWRWNEDSKVDFVYRDLFYTGSGSNYHHYSDAKADELTDLVATEKDPEKRLADAKELQEYLVDACPQVPLYIANLVIAYNKNLKGEYLYGGGNHDWRHAYIAE